MPRISDRYIQPGDVLDITAPYALTPGDGCLIGNLFGMSLDTSANGAAARIQPTGVWDIAKTAAQTFAQGALVYWDNAAKSVTSVSTGNTRIGSATQAAAGGDATARVRLSGNPAPTGA
jgi:predicted RecA/RadA family phage recombinase